MRHRYTSRVSSVRREQLSLVRIVYSLCCCTEVILEFSYRGFPADYTKLAEMEFYLLEDLEFDLIVFHPYRTLAAVCGREPVDAGEFPDESARIDEEASAAEKVDRLFGKGSGQPGSDVEDSILQMAW
jgi:cyclin C